MGYFFLRPMKVAAAAGCSVTAQLAAQQSACTQAPWLGHSGLGTPQTMKSARFVNKKATPYPIGGWGVRPGRLATEVSPASQFLQVANEVLLSSFWRSANRLNFSEWVSCSSFCSRFVQRDGSSSDQAGLVFSSSSSLRKSE